MPKTWDKKYEKGRKYKVEWERNFAWVSTSPDGADEAFCKLCRRTVLAKKNAIIQHEKTELHKSCQEGANTNRPVAAFFLAGEQKRRVQQAELTLAVQTACHTSITSIDHLGEILVKHGKKSELGSIKLHRTKCTKLITEVIAPVFKEIMLDDVGDKRFSLIIDETTDVSTEKELAVIIRYYSESNQKITDCLLELVPMCSATGETIFNAIEEALMKCNLSLKHCIGLGCDGASKMVGLCNSVWSRLKERNPDCVLMRCICHSLALCIQHGFEKLPSNISYLLQEIPGWFSHSKLRREEFKALYEEMADESPSDMPFTRFSQTRWLSRGKVIARIYKNWNVLKRYFSAINSDQQKLNGAQRYKAREILNMIRDDANHLYLTFALPIVTQFERVNAFFQSDKANPNVAVDELNLHYRSLKARVYDMNGNERSITLVDFGSQFALECFDFLRSSTLDALKNLKLRCLDMLKECIIQVERRLPDQKNVFTALLALGPCVVLSQTQRRKFENLPFQYLLREDANTIEEQYRQLLHVDWRPQFPNNEIPPGSEQFWTAVSKFEDGAGSKKFYELSLYCLACLSIPLSNAIVERLFSSVTFVKNSYRNRMSMKTLEAITRIRTTLHFQSKCCKDFVATERMFTLFNTNSMYLSAPNREDDSQPQEVNELEAAN